MVIIKFSVKGQRLILETDLKGLQPTSDSYNYYKCLFEFDSNWDGFEKRVYFKNASFNITKPMLPDDLGYCYIPSEVLAHTGVIVCTVTGVKYSGTSVAERLTAGPVKFFVRNPKESKPFDIFIQKEEGTLEPDNPDITPTEYEQFVGKIKSYANDAAASKSAAEAAIEEIEGILDSAFEAVENKIDSMTVSASAGEAYSAPEVIRTDYEDHFNLEFVIPKGDPGEDGLDGEDGFSPIASVSKDGDTATITITDSLGTTTAEVSDGQDGNDGADGHSPVITANKVDKVTTVYVDGVVIATINDGHDGGGASLFIAEYGVTTYADVKDAYDEDAIIICTVDDSGNTVICQLAYFDDANDTFIFAQPVSDGAYWTSIASDDTWDDGYFQFASTDTATQLRNGLMSALDWQKLDGIASGAEVNVQSDWSEADSTNDAYIKNKPTIPSVSGLLDIFYPIGSYYETSDTSFDPNISWGGTWSLETEGLVHIGAGSNYTVGGTGGEKTHKLTAAEAAQKNLGAIASGSMSANSSHSHGTGEAGEKYLISTANVYVSENKYSYPATSSSGVRFLVTTSTGTQYVNEIANTASASVAHTHSTTISGSDASSAHNNMQPYVVVNRWHRTA